MNAIPLAPAYFGPVYQDAQRFDLEALRVQIAADIATIRLTNLLGLHPHDCADFLKAAAFANTLNIALNNVAFLEELGLVHNGYCQLEMDDLAVQSVSHFPGGAKLFLRLNDVSAPGRSGAQSG